MTKKRLTTRPAAILTALALAAAAPVHAGGIPTFDGAAVSQAIQQGIQMKQQIDNQLKQISELKSQVKALTGSRNIGKLLRNEAQEALPDEWKAVYEAAKNRAAAAAKTCSPAKPTTPKTATNG